MLLKPETLQQWCQWCDFCWTQYSSKVSTRGGASLTWTLNCTHWLCHRCTVHGGCKEWIKYLSLSTTGIHGNRPFTYSGSTVHVTQSLGGKCCVCLLWDSHALLSGIASNLCWMQRKVSQSLHEWRYYFPSLCVCPTGGSIWNHILEI